MSDHTWQKKLISFKSNLSILREDGNMDNFPLKIVQNGLRLGTAEFYKLSDFRMPGEITVDKDLTITKYIERICQTYNLKLLGNADYNQLEMRIQSGLYDNALKQEPVLPWEILHLLLASLTDLESLLALRNTCKGFLLFFDTHINQIWHDICLRAVPYRNVSPQLPSVHALTPFLKRYYRIYYTCNIHHFIGLEDALQFHLIHGQLNLFLDLTMEHKMKAPAIAMVATKYLRDEQTKLFVNLFKGSEVLFYCLCYCCTCEESRMSCKISVFLECNYTAREMVVLLACAWQGGRDNIAKRFFSKLKETGLLTVPEFSRLLISHPLTKDFNHGLLKESYVNLCGSDLPAAGSMETLRLNIEIIFSKLIN